MKTLAEITKQQKIIVMVGAMLAMFLAALDQTIVGTAMPKIVKELNGFEHLSWVFTAYMLASTVSVPIAGKLSDIYGRKTFFLGGIIVFLIGSALSGQAQSMTQLITFRALQGIGAGTIMTNAFAIIGDLFPPKERGKWQGAFGGIFGLSSVIGPLLGGYLTDAASWRWTFYINVPIGIVALGFIYFLMPKIKSHFTGKRSIDFAGAILLILGLVPLLLGLVWGGNEYPWLSGQILGLFTLGIISLISFGFVERKAAEPIIPLSLFHNKIFTVSVLITFLTAMSMFGAIVYIPLFAQTVLGTSATDSGFILTPLMLGMIAASAFSGQVISRKGKYKALAIIGTGIITLALFFLSMINAQTSTFDLIARMVLLGIGLGMTFPIFNIAVQNAFGHEKLGVVTAGIQLFRSVGGTVGTAVMGSILNLGIFTGITKLANDPSLRELNKTIPSFSPESFDANVAQNFLSTEVQTKMQAQFQQLPQPIQEQTMQSFAHFVGQIKIIMASSISEMFVIGTILTAIAFIISFFLKEIPLKHTHKSLGEELGDELANEGNQTNSGRGTK